MITFERLVDGSWSKKSNWPQDAKMAQIGIDVDLVFGYYPLSEALRIIEDGIRGGNTRYNRYVIVPVCSQEYSALTTESSDSDLIRNRKIHKISRSRLFQNFHLTEKHPDSLPQYHKY